MRQIHLSCMKQREHPPQMCHAAFCEIRARKLLLYVTYNRALSDLLRRVHRKIDRIKDLKDSSDDFWEYPLDCLTKHGHVVI